jgi:hypothetical protein
MIMANRKALINYYAKLLQKGAKKEGEIPVDIRAAVMKKFATLPPLPFDPVTQTPALGQEESITN